MSYLLMITALDCKALYLSREGRQVGPLSTEFQKSYSTSPWGFFGYYKKNCIRFLSFSVLGLLVETSKKGSLKLKRVYFHYF